MLKHLPDVQGGVWQESLSNYSESGLSRVEQAFPLAARSNWYRLHHESPLFLSINQSPGVTLTPVKRNELTKGRWGCEASGKCYAILEWMHVRERERGKGPRGSMVSRESRLSHILSLFYSTHYDCHVMNNCLRSFFSLSRFEGVKTIPRSGMHLRRFWKYYTTQKMLR